METHLLRKHTAAWSAHLQAVRKEQKRKEERQLQALAACRVGLPESPPTAAWQCQQGMQALQVADTSYQSGPVTALQRPDNAQKKAIL